MPEVVVRKKKPRRKTYRERIGEWLYENRPKLAVAGAFIIAVSVAALCFKLSFQS